ncbi:MAG: class I SAM-dependent RNA methyltransferase [Candidatus Krumholzibacteriia bacterium]
MQDAVPGSNDPTVTLHVEKIVTGGAGLAHHEGRTVFVPLTAPGDEVRVRLEQVRRSFVTGTVEEVLTPGPDRRPGPCPHFGVGLCGGCDLQHLTDAAQRTAKREIVADCFRRLGGLDVGDRIEGPDADLPPLHYRNQLRLFASPMGPYGLRRRGTRDVLPLETCLLVPEIFTRDILPWLRLLPPVEQLVLRFDHQDRWLVSMYGNPQRMKILRKLTTEGAADRPPASGCAGIQFNNRPVWGRDYLVVHCAGKKYKVSAQSFFQTNLAVAERAVAQVRTWLDELPGAGRLLADLYSGVGLFSLALADRFERLVAADADPGSVQDADNNIRRDPVARDRGQAVVRTAEDALADTDLLPRAALAEGCCVVDPPRAGLGAETCRALLEARPAAVIYMSCDPATLARDCRLLSDGGQVIRHVRVLDMFPQTAHVETLVLLTPGPADDRRTEDRSP